MQYFAAIDFETANGRRSSVCSVGVVIVREGKIVDRFYSLIQPSPNYYTYWTTAVHGLTHEDTDNQPAFPEVWAQVEGRIAGLPLVAHNSPFDESCLKAVFFGGGRGEIIGFSSRWRPSSGWRYGSFRSAVCLPAISGQGMFPVISLHCC